MWETEMKNLNCRMKKKRDMSRAEQRHDNFFLKPARKVCRKGVICTGPGRLKGLLMMLRCTCWVWKTASHPMWLENRLPGGRDADARYEGMKLEGRRVKGAGGGDRTGRSLNARPGV